MVDANLSAKILLSIKAQVNVDTQNWKDEAFVKLIFGRAFTKKTVQGGAPDLIPGESVSNFELETGMTSDLVDTVGPTPTDTKSISYYVYQIQTLGVFPVIVFKKISTSKDNDTVTLQWTGWITEIEPANKEEGSDDERFIMRGEIKSFDVLQKS